MRHSGATLRLDSNGGRKTGGASGRRWGAATLRRVAAPVLLTVVALLLGACATEPRVLAPAPDRGALAEAFRASVGAGLGLYEGGEFTLAAQRFHEAAGHARAFGGRGLEKEAVASECMAWLRARRLSELAACSRRLEALQRGERRSDPGVNTLIAFGAIAGDRPLPPLRIPSTVRPLVQASAAEAR